MKIAIIGAGQVGGALGARWAARGHAVAYGVRDPDGERARAALASSGPAAHAARPREAAEWGDVVVLAVPHGALAEMLPALGDLGGKVVIDAVNDVAAPAGAPAVAAQVAGLAPGARVVKAFNTMGWNVMTDPAFGDEHADNYICGDDDGAKAIVAELSRAIGFAVVDAGPLANAALLEGLARFWIDLVLRRGLGREIAFRLLRR